MIHSLPMALFQYIRVDMCVLKSYTLIITQQKERLNMTGRAKNKVPLKLYIDKDLKEEFRKYTSDSDMSKVLTSFIESYVKKAKKREKQK